MGQGGGEGRPWLALLIAGGQEMPYVPGRDPAAHTSAKFLADGMGELRHRWTGFLRILVSQNAHFGGSEKVTNFVPPGGEVVRPSLKGGPGQGQTVG